MKPQLAYLMLASCACLAGLTTIFLWLMRDQQRIQQRINRIKTVSGEYRASGSGRSSDRAPVDLQVQAANWMSRALTSLRYNPAHSASYPLKPIVVLMITLMPSAIFARLVTTFVGPLGWIATPLACLLMCRLFYGHCEDRLQAMLFRQFPDALAMIVRAVRVGLPIVEAIRIVSRENPEPTAREFTALVARTSIGVPLDDALREMAERNGLAEYRFFATALSLQSQTGGGLAETLENLAETIRKRMAAKMRGHALAAEARMSSYILGALPVVTGTLLLLTNPGYIGVLFTDPTGRNLLLAAVALLSMGAFTMRMLIRKSLS